MKARKKPVVVEAWQCNNPFQLIDFLEDNIGDVECPLWLEEAYENDLYCDEGGELWIRTLEGDHHVSVGDYIIKGVHGEIYPCKPDIFLETYEIVED